MPVLDSGGMFKCYDLHKFGVLSIRIEDMDALSLVQQICHGSSENNWRKLRYTVYTLCHFKIYKETGCKILKKFLLAIYENPDLSSNI